MKSYAAIEQKDDHSDETNTDFENEHQSLFNRPITHPTIQTSSITSTVTTQTDAIAMNKSTVSVTKDFAKDSIEKEDNHAISKPL